MIDICTIFVPYKIMVLFKPVVYSIELSFNNQLEQRHLAKWCFVVFYEVAVILILWDTIKLNLKDMIKLLYSL